MFQKNKVRKLKKDYQHKNLKNPFFKQKKEGRGSRFYRWLIIILIIIVLASAWFFLAAPTWIIKNINITGLSRINENELKEVIYNRLDTKKYSFFNEENIFLFDREEAITEINNLYNFSQVDIKKILPNTLEIVISERPYAFIFQQGSDLYYASKDAYIINEEEVKEEDYEKYFILENNSVAVFINSNNQINLKNEYLDFAFALNESLKNYPDFNAERFIIDQELNSLTVKFFSGPLVYFNIKNEAAEQLADLDLVKKEKMGDNFNSTNYIDLRYGNRIFIN